jgi:hypothetical protein
MSGARCGIITLKEDQVLRFRVPYIERDPVFRPGGLNNKLSLRPPASPRINRYDRGWRSSISSILIRDQQMTYFRTAPNSISQ